MRHHCFGTWLIQLMQGLAHLHCVIWLSEAGNHSCSRRNVHCRIVVQAESLSRERRRCYYSPTSTPHADDRTLNQQSNQHVPVVDSVEFLRNA